MFARKQKSQHSEPAPLSNQKANEKADEQANAKSGREDHTDNLQAAHEPTQTPAPSPLRGAARRSASLIGKGLVIKGSIEGEENIVVAGRVEGSITLRKGDLTVAVEGSVDADLSAATATIEGTMVGDVRATELVTIAGGGNMQGDIVAPRVALQDGARFKGSIDMDSGSVDASNTAAPLDSARLNTA